MWHNSSVCRIRNNVTALHLGINVNFKQKEPSIIIKTYTCLLTERGFFFLRPPATLSVIQRVLSSNLQQRHPELV